MSAPYLYPSNYAATQRPINNIAYPWPYGTQASAYPASPPIQTSAPGPNRAYQAYPSVTPSYPSNLYSQPSNRFVPTTRPTPPSSPTSKLSQQYQAADLKRKMWKLYGTSLGMMLLGSALSRFGPLVAFQLKKPAIANISNIAGLGLSFAGVWPFLKGEDAGRAWRQVEQLPKEAWTKQGLMQLAIGLPMMAPALLSLFGKPLPSLIPFSRQPIVNMLAHNFLYDVGSIVGGLIAWNGFLNWRKSKQ